MRDLVHGQQIGERTCKKNHQARVQGEPLADVLKAYDRRYGVDGIVDGAERNIDFIVPPQNLLHKSGKTSEAAGYKLCRADERLQVESHNERAHADQQDSPDLRIDRVAFPFKERMNAALFFGDCLYTHKCMPLC